MKQHIKLNVYDYEGQRTPIAQTVLSEHDPGANNTHAARVKMPDGSTMAFFAEVAPVHPLIEAKFGHLNQFECFILRLDDSIGLEYYKTVSTARDFNAMGVQHDSRILVDDDTLVLIQEPL